MTDAHHWGVQTEYHDASHRLVAAATEAVRGGALDTRTPATTSTARSSSTPATRSTSPSRWSPRMAVRCCSRARSAADVPLGYHTWNAPDGPRRLVRQPRSLPPAARPSAGRLGGAGVQRPIAVELGHRRPRRPARLRRVGRPARGRVHPDQPDQRRGGGATGRAQPLPAHQPALAQPPVPPGRGGARRRRHPGIGPRDGGRGGPGPQQRPPHRPRRRGRSQARRAAAPPRRRPAVCRLRELARRRRG